MPDSAPDLIALGYIVAAIAVARIGAPQAARFFARFLVRDGYGWYRFMWAVLMAAICLTSLRESLVFSNWAFFNQALLGTIEQRWPAELAIAWFKAVACVFAACLYDYTQHRARRLRKGVGQ